MADDPSTTSHGFDKSPRMAKAKMEATVHKAHRAVMAYEVRTFFFSLVRRVLKRLMEALVRPMEET